MRRAPLRLPHLDVGTAAAGGVGDAARPDLRHRRRRRLGESGAVPARRARARLRHAPAPTSTPAGDHRGPSPAPVVADPVGPGPGAAHRRGGKITDVSVLQYPNGNPRDQEINDYALPILIQETLDAQSAKIDMVSGATVTSAGYLQSLQSALDQAGL